MARGDGADAASGRGSPTPTCSACILRCGRILLIQRAQEPNKGYWSFPGGRVELGETIFEAVRREVQEETGLTIEPERVFQVSDWITRDEAGDVRFHYVVNYVRCRHVAGEPCATDEAADVRWALESDIPGLMMDPFVRETAFRLLRGEEC